ncbi:hypothetical protein AVEN_43204-1 [Araneus ventricosus]|uniref:Uncharacterized protein n=1 Tax=Araneus ventricosus TaxID=182803 RepID=A0A4Y1ZQE2_ARAVE|nr:hypothetical protein AVEN_244229-1 [Araneus ventricosus]GBL60767.1 hypothetical protein AVEN_267273-1 [Araneus ventricosus]GBL60797.1 hypothetical protein AVEN_19931-1 [Araneus ventricosus]GBL60833.1 hypothetical protein AVEN_43204-1 [Araneus ventricosus]
MVSASLLTPKDIKSTADLILSRTKKKNCLLQQQSRHLFLNDKKLKIENQIVKSGIATPGRKALGAYANEIHVPKVIHFLSTEDVGQHCRGMFKRVRKEYMDSFSQGEITQPY